MRVFDPNKPYNHLPPLPPNIDLETSEVLKACIEANKELAKLKMAERLIPNQTVLINSIPLLESQASSAIENIVTTTDDLFKIVEHNLDERQTASKHLKILCDIGVLVEIRSGREKIFINEKFLDLLKGK